MKQGRLPIHYLLVFAVLFATAFLHAGAAAHQEEDDIPEAPNDAQATEVIPDEPPAPTETLPPAEPPTAIPEQPTATQPPQPTPEPTTPPSPSPTATATATATATFTATAPPTPTPSVPSTPTATVSPTPTPKARSVIAPQSIVSGSGCLQTSASDVVETTGFVSFSCEGRTAPIFTFYSGTVAAPTAGWQFRINGGTWTSSGASLPTTGVLLLRSVPAFTIDLRPTSTVAPGSAGSVTVNVSCSSGCAGASDYTATLGASRTAPVPTAADLQVACTPATITGTSGQPQTVTCTYSARSTLGSRQVTLSQVTAQAPAGWAIASTAGTTAGTTLTIRPNVTIAYRASSPVSYTFTYTLTPSCTATTTPQPLQIASVFAFGTTANIAGASTTTSIARSAASSLTLSVKSSSLAWNQTASFSSTSVEGNLTYRIIASGCNGWSVSVAAGPYVYSGPNSSTSIPASNLRLTDVGSPTAIEGSTTGVTRTSSTGSMASPQKVLSASSGSGNGTYEQDLDMSLTIPGNTRAGTYTSTITLTSVAAP